MQAEVAVIGGTGIGHRLAAMGGRAVHVPTPFGLMRGRLLDIRGRSTLLIQRHSVGHKSPPHAVNYRAFAVGAKALGVRACFATAAVGGLREDWPGGTLAVCDDFVDFTYRNLTLFESGVRHTDFTYPMALGSVLSQAADALQIPVKTSGTYIGGNGPRYETPTEVRWLATIGDVVGMTSSSEAIAFGEAEIPYGLICVVTNPGAGLSANKLTHDEVVEVMEERGKTVVQLLEEAIARV